MESTLNPIALRKAKTLWSFGLSECNRVTAINAQNWLLEDQVLFLLTLLHSERPKLYTILAFLSAIGLRVDPYSIVRQLGGKNENSGVASPESVPIHLNHYPTNFMFVSREKTPFAICIM